MVKIELVDDFEEAIVAEDLLALIVQQILYSRFRIRLDRLLSGSLRFDHDERLGPVDGRQKLYYRDGRRRPDQPHQASQQFPLPQSPQQGQWMKLPAPNCAVHLESL